MSVASTLLGVVASVAASAAGYQGASELAGDLASDTGAIVGYATLVGKFDRDQEYEADHVGLMLMGKAGYNPEAAIRFWNRAEEIFGSSDSTLGAFFSTHPASGDRAEALQEALPLSLKYYNEYLNNTKTKKSK